MHYHLSVTPLYLARMSDADLKRAEITLGGQPATPAEIRQELARMQQAGEVITLKECDNHSDKGACLGHED